MVKGGNIPASMDSDLEAFVDLYIPYVAQTVVPALDTVHRYLSEIH